MGANEKYEATYHGALSEVRMNDDLTRIKHTYADAMRAKTGVGTATFDAEFDRFITKIRAEAKAEALNEVLTVLQAEIEDAPPANHEEDNYEAGYIAGLDFLLNAKALANQYKEAPSA